MNILSQEFESQLLSLIGEQVKVAVADATKQEEGKRYLTAKEAAEYCGVDRQTIDSWVIEQGLPKIKIGARLVRFDKSDLDQVMQGNKI